MSNATHPIRDKHTWIRFVFLILYSIIFSIAQYLVFVVALLLAIISLFKRTPNENLQSFGAGLAEYSRLLTRYLSYNTQAKPFPFSEWKAGDKPDADMTAKAAEGKKPAAASAARSATTKAKTAKKPVAKKPAAKKPAAKPATGNQAK